MHYFLVLVVLYIMYLDAIILKKIYKQGGYIFSFFYNKKAILLFSFIFLLLSVSSLGRDIVGFFIFLFFLPYYLLRRRQIVRLIYSNNITVPLSSDALAVVLIWTFSIFVITLILSYIYRLFPQQDSEMKQLLISAVLSSLVALRLVYRASKRFSSRGFILNMRLNRGGKSSFQIIVLPAIIGLVFAYFSSAIIYSRSYIPHTPLNDLIINTRSSDVFVCFLIIAVLFAPLVEEIIFRGYFFYVIDTEKGRLVAIFIVSLVFAILHVGQYWGDWQAIFMITILGFSLTCIRAITDRTLASVVKHYVYNGGIVFISALMGTVKNAG